MSFTGASYCKILRSLKPAVHEATLSLLRYCTQQISSYLLVTCLLWIGNIVVWKHHHEPQRALWQCMAGLSLKNSPERWSQQCRYQCASSSAPTKLYNHKITLNYQLNNLVIMKLHEWNSRKCTKFDIYVLGCKDCVSAHSIYYIIWQMCLRIEYLLGHAAREWRRETLSSCLWIRWKWSADLFDYL